MKNNTFNLFAVVAITTMMLFSIIGKASAEEVSYKLQYQKQNHWVAKEDAQSLRDLIKQAKKVSANKFYVVLPQEKRETSVERLIILRDILERQLKHQIIIEEIEGTPAENAIIVSM